MPCPDFQTIKEILGGDDALSRQYSEHIRSCSECQTLLDRLAEDPELQSWRDCLASTPPPPRSDECTRLVERLRARGAQTTELDAQLSTPVSDDAKLIVSALDPGTLVDHFRIVRELGRGGMSIVMEAIDTRLNRPVALKLMLGPTLSGKARARFVREATSISSIQHPNVVSVFGAEYEGTNGPYLAMELVHGPNLKEWIANGDGFKFKESARLIAQVADGLGAAHRAGILHRDIKPSNILIAERRDEGANQSGSAIPKLADFGLALPLHLDNKLTVSGMLAGTPAYASPEQITAPASMSPQSDIYSLGVTLYETITGTVPFHGSAQNVLKQIVDGEYVTPRRLNKEIPKDLETICLKAMSLSANQRYSTAEALATDLRHWLAGEPIVARPSSSLERTYRWAVRNPRVASLLALVTTLLVMIAIGSSYAAITINAAQKELQAESVKVKLASEAAEKSASIAMDQRELALDSLNQLINGVQTQLSGRAGTLKLREELLRTAASGLTRIAEGADTSRLEQATIDAHQQLAKIHSILGDTKEAKLHLQQAIELCESALQERADDVNLKRNLADALSLEADFHRNEFATDKVEATLKRVLELRKAVADSLRDQDATRRLYIVKQQLADIAWNRGDLVSALPVFEECAEEAKVLHEKRPEEKQLIRDMYILHNRIGAVLSQQNKPVESEGHFEISRRYTDLLLKLDPENQDYQVDAAYVVSRIARMKLNAGDLTTASELILRAIAQYEAVAAQDLDNVRFQSLVGSAHSLNCEIALAKGNFDDVRKSAQTNIAIQMQLAKQYPDTSKYCLLASQSFGMIADVNLRQGDFGGAISELRTIIDALEQCRKTIDPSQATTVTQVLEHDQTIEAALKLLQSEKRVTSEQLEVQPTIARCASAYLLYEQTRLEQFERLSETAIALEDLSMISGMNLDLVELLIARAYGVAFGKLARADAANAPSDSKLASEFKQKCIGMCRTMTQRNPQLVQYLATEPDFASVRSDSDFQVLMGK